METVSIHTDTHTRSGMGIRRFTLLLAFISSIVWMGTSIYVPALPMIGRDLSMTGGQLSHTMTLYYICFAGIMLAVGRMSDAWGRRRLILAGLVLFQCGNVMCSLACGPLLLYIREDLALFRRMLLSRQFLLVGNALFCGIAFFGAYVAAAPYLLQETLGLTPVAFGAANILVAGGLAGGQFLSSQLVMQIPAERVYRVGGLIALAAGLSMGGLVLADTFTHVALVMVPLALFSFSFGLMEPVGLKSALTRFRESSGTASGLYFCLLLACQGLGSLVAGIVMGTGFSAAAALAVVMAPAGITAAVLARASRACIR